MAFLKRKPFFYSKVCRRQYLLLFEILIQKRLFSIFSKIENFFRIYPALALTKKALEALKL